MRPKTKKIKNNKKKKNLKKIKNKIKRESLSELVADNQKEPNQD